MERIVKAAVRVGTEVYKGQSHLQALEDFFQKTNQEVPDNAEDGFLTDTGRFVDFEETLRIGKANGQLRGDETVLTLDSSFLSDY